MKGFERGEKVEIAGTRCERRVLEVCHVRRRCECGDRAENEGAR